MQRVGVSVCRCVGVSVCRYVVCAVGCGLWTHTASVSGVRFPCTVYSAKESLEAATSSLWLPPSAPASFFFFFFFFYIYFFFFIYIFFLREIFYDFVVLVYFFD